MNSRQVREQIRRIWELAAVYAKCFSKPVLIFVLIAGMIVPPFYIIKAREATTQERPKPQVVDTAGMIDSHDREFLEKIVQNMSDDTGLTVMVETVLWGGVDGCESIDQFARCRFDEIPQNESCCLLVVAEKDQWGTGGSYVQSIQLGEKAQQIISEEAVEDALTAISIRLTIGGESVGSAVIVSVFPLWRSTLNSK